MLKLFKKYSKGYRFLIIIAPLCKILEAVFELLVPLVIKKIIDEGINGDLSKDDKINFILKNGAYLFVFALVGLIFTLICQYLACVSSQGFGNKLRNEVFKHINSLSFKEIDELSASGIIIRLTLDCNNVETALNRIIRLLVRAPLLVVGAVILSYTISFKAGIIFTIVGIILFFIMYLITRITVPMNKKVQSKQDRVTQITKENLSGNRVVRSFSKEDYEYNRFVLEQEQLQKMQINAGRVNTLLSPVTFFVVSLASALIVYVGGKEFEMDNMSSGDLQALINYFLQMQLAIIAVTNLVNFMTKGMASAKRINELFAVKNCLTYGNEDVSKTNTAIEFKNVSFSYNDGAKPALDDLNFKILSGMKVGIIGSTGSGKSSISNLINRFYDATKGEILIYGKDIKSYKKEAINSAVSTVMQRATLFTGTIKSNLLHANKNLTDDEIDEFLKISQAYEFVYKKDLNVNEPIYQGGKNLSGGQRQRLSIARGLAKKSDILILDDSSSALDFKTESLLRHELFKLDKTLIQISQRASTVMHMDMIIVLDNGHIDSIGTHTELLKKSLVYQEICHSQDLKEVA